MYVRTSAILVTLALLMAAAVFYQLRYPFVQSQPILPTSYSALPQVGDAGAPSLEPFAPAALATLSDTVERPLFSSTRREQVIQATSEPSAPTPVSAPVKPPNLTLTAIVIEGENRIAVVQNGDSGNFERLREGDQFSGWTVNKVAAETLSLVQGQQSHEVSLRQFQPAPAPSRAATRKRSVSTTNPRTVQRRRMRNVRQPSRNQTTR